MWRGSGQWHYLSFSLAKSNKKITAGTAQQNDVYDRTVCLPTLLIAQETSIIKGPRPKASATEKIENILECTELVLLFIKTVRTATMFSPEKKPQTIMPTLIQREKSLDHTMKSGMIGNVYHRDMQ